MREIIIPNSIKFIDDLDQLSLGLDSDVIKLLGSSTSLILGSLSSTKFTAELETIKSYLTQQDITCEELIINSVSDLELRSPADSRIINATDSIVVFGGGRIQDYAKVLSQTTNKPLITIPTLISHDGLYSPIAVIQGQSKGAKIPDALILINSILTNISTENIQAGIGDLIANLSAIEDWYISAVFNKEEINQDAIIIAKTATFNILHFLSNKYQDIKTGIIDPIKLLHSEEFMKLLLKSLILSGMAMLEANNSRPCSGAEHLLSHAIDELYGANTKAQHGIQVLVTTMFLEEIRSLYRQEIPFLQEIAYEYQAIMTDEKNNQYSLFDLMNIIECPIYFEDIDIDQQTDLAGLMARAPFTRKDRFTILNLIQGHTEAS